MGVVPVGSGLLQGELEKMRSARLDGNVGQPRNAVLAVGNQEAVPVDRGIGVQAVVDADARSIALFPAQGRCGNLSVYGESK